MHEFMDNMIDCETVYRTINIYDISRYIWFFADAPHLMKTTKNCIHHSGYGKTRLMWNNGKEILWSHIITIVNDDLNRGLKLLPKLTLQHINLTPYSVMTVSLATQVLSLNVANVIKNYYPPNMHATAEFCYFMDCFFDCLNVRNQGECIRDRKDLLPYRSVYDQRFYWLKHTFLGYLKTWKQSCIQREGNFTKSAQDKMFLTWQTYEGLVMTVYSVIEATTFLLKSGMPFVLTEKFNQDVVEKYFGRHRCLGRRNDNPTIQQFGYNSNMLR